jgi:hypothetical protein
MSLTLFAARALVGNYLDGRVLPGPVLAAVLGTVERRLIAGTIPLIDGALRELIDRESGEPASSIPAVLRAD